MKNNIIVFTVLFCLGYNYSALAQETFLKIYTSSDYKKIMSIIETDDDHLVFCGIVYPNAGAIERKGTVTKIDLSGNLLLSRDYEFNCGNSAFAELINLPSTSGEYLLLGAEDSIGGGISYNSVFIHTIDNDLDIIQKRNFGLWADTTNNAWDFELLNDTTAYILSSFRTPNSSLYYNYSIIKAHLTTGDYCYYVADNLENKAGTNISIDEQNEQIWVNYFNFSTTLPANPIAKFGLNLNDIEIVLPDNQFYTQAKLAKMCDSTYLLSATCYVYNPQNRDLGVAEYNLQDSLLKLIKFPGGIDSITYPGSGRRNILVTSDYIWIMGWYNCLTSMPPCFDEPTYIMLNKLNHNLELIEQLFYGGDGVYNPNDIIETNDNHIVVAGDFFDPYAVPFNCHFDPFILKVNSEGLIVNTQNHELPQVHEAILVPNPGKEFLAVKLAIQHHAAVLQLFDIGGRLLFTEQINTDMQQVNTSALPAGIYPYRITAGNRIIGWGKWVKE